MAFNNDFEYISGYTARKILKCSKEEFECLVDNGLIKAFRDEERRWRVSKESVLNYQNRPISLSATHLVTNANHYEEVIQRMCNAKQSVKIMTGDFKRFNLKPTNKQGKDYKDGTPFIKYLMDKAKQGVSVQIICSRPSDSFTEEWQECYEQMGQPDKFEYMFCIRNHVKAYVIDDKIAYVGSANVTPAGLGQGIFTPGNFEAGIITNDAEVVKSVREIFSTIWDENCCEGCHRADKCDK